MVILNGQAFDTEKFYNKLGITRMEEYARKTGLLTENIGSLDAKILLDIIKNHSSDYNRILEVGCGYGRIGEEFINEFNILYSGIDLNENFINFFKSKLNLSQRNNIFHGNFLEYDLPKEYFDWVIFPWSVIGDFNSNEGQIAALKKSREIIVPHGKILFDVPKDIVNKFEGYSSGNFNIHEIYDLSKIGLEYSESYPYTTHTERKREIIELSCRR